MPTRVLIAEDEAIVRLDLKETLEEEGYEVVGETGRGDEAVQLVRTTNPTSPSSTSRCPASTASGRPGDRRRPARRGVILTAFSQRDLIDGPATRAPSPTW